MTHHTTITIPRCSARQLTDDQMRRVQDKIGALSAADAVASVLGADAERSAQAAANASRQRTHMQVALPLVILARLRRYAERTGDLMVDPDLSAERAGWDDLAAQLAGRAGSD